MTKKEDKLFEEYAVLENQITALEEKKDELKAKILGTLETRGIDTLQEDFGTFSVVRRKAWTYTEGLTQKEKEYKAIIKERQTEEQENGEAKSVENKTLSYRKYEPKT